MGPIFRASDIPRYERKLFQTVRSVGMNRSQQKSFFKHVFAELDSGVGFEVAERSGLLLTGFWLRFCELDG